jgi:PAS domain S-box-containing protein
MKSEFSDRLSPGQLNSFALLLHRMINRIRQSLELSEILKTTVAEVRIFLKTDRVKIYRFHPDGSGEVVAESIKDQCLPSLLGHNFPASDIPSEARDLFRTIGQRSIVDVANQQIGLSSFREGSAEVMGEMDYRPVDPCHVEYLVAMGVSSSLVVPIRDGENLWGLLVSHHSLSRHYSDQELQVVQLVADQVAVSIAQANLLHQTRLSAMQEATINRITALLHSTPEMQLQAALEQTIVALQGFGGRLYISLPNSQFPLHLPQHLFTVGSQPITPQDWQSEEATSQLAEFSPFEHHPHWQTWLEMEEPVNSSSGVWAIADLYQAVMPSDLVTALIEAQIRGVLILRLQYGSHRLGYLTVFRDEIDVERIWAGHPDRDHPQHLRPRQSFETWRELKRNQAHLWTLEDIELVKALGYHFAIAIHQSILYQQVCALNTDLAEDIQRRKQIEQEIIALNSQLEQRVRERTLELQQANVALVEQIAEREKTLLERQQAEASLQRLSHQQELILDSAGEGIYGIDPQGKITFANPAAAKMLGYSIDELIGHWMHMLVDHARPDGTPYLVSDNPILETVQAGVVHSGSNDLFHRRDGSSFPIEYVSSPIWEQNQIIGAVVVFKDITTRQQIERMKDEFISIVSHELRTPLTSIRSTLWLLANGWLDSHPEKSKRMLDIAFSNTNRLVRLVSDFLDIERIKFGKITMDKRTCNAGDLMIQSADTVRAMAEKAGIHLAIAPIDAELWADPDRIIQTFTNLLGNAIKFSPVGSTVWLTAEVLNNEPDHSIAPTTTRISEDQIANQPNLSSPTSILFKVQDQGIGIPSDKLETIFDRFQQVNISHARGHGGTGLGLMICRGIVHQHNGRIWAESQLGAGSTFYVLLPCQHPSQQHS